MKGDCTAGESGNGEPMLSDVTRALPFVTAAAVMALVVRKYQG